MQKACVPSEQPVSAIFVDLERMDELKVWMRRLTQAHPSAAIALLQSDPRRSGSLLDIIHFPSICGVLPMHLKLDVWLTVIRLILFGGEYIPVSMLRGLPAPDGPAAGSSLKTTPEDGDGEDLYSLTERELEILELVARGLQNKVIAGTLRLSEHTVKIHLHNIITKLGTTNRTEAAAVFHRRKGGDKDDKHAPARMR